MDRITWFMVVTVVPGYYNAHANIPPPSDAPAPRAAESGPMITAQELTTRGPSLGEAFMELTRDEAECTAALEGATA